MISTDKGNLVAKFAQSYFHHYRVQMIARWPESEYKQAALSAARTALTGELAFQHATAHTIFKRR